MSLFVSFRVKIVAEDPIVEALQSNHVSNTIDSSSLART